MFVHTNGGEKIVQIGAENYQVRQNDERITSYEVIYPDGKKYQWQKDDVTAYDEKGELVFSSFSIFARFIPFCLVRI
ncbi:hypothetical protein JCM10914A_19620 [Paenibacillus sp. JCM 10914]|uniref:hypothetical protein n=1 Tax=Paenibacillus sp. JCM 10914 TaxID=1236974 RepID=UPI0003CC60C3|nr:hypothetical protein [Paenibacillus sp. JCM 10914]GAE06155.1 hypothetical protein JCM10914_2301 [Paenibacillus sp. JCM 10914]